MEVGIDGVGVAQNYVDVLDMLIVGHTVGGCGLNGCGLPECGLNVRGLFGHYRQPLEFGSVGFVAIAVVIVVVLIVVDFSAVELCIFDALISFS